jgi:hypothetical protein
MLLVFSSVLIRTHPIIISFDISSNTQMKRSRVRKFSALTQVGALVSSGHPTLIMSLHLHHTTNRASCGTFAPLFLCIHSIHMKIKCFALLGRVACYFLEEQMESSVRGKQQQEHRTNVMIVAPSYFVTVLLYSGLACF